MSELKIKVKYHDIEIEVSIPAKDSDPASDRMTSNTKEIAFDLVEQATKQIEKLIITGRTNH